jgi:hypothetical protein
MVGGVKIRLKNDFNRNDLGGREMRKLSIDETWDYTKRMWKWVAFQVEVLKDERSVFTLKKVWLEENEPEFTGMVSDCFFCQNRVGDCDTTCPGSLVEKGFSCCNLAHHYEDHPGAFYREILRLDAIRTAVPPEHQWEHGDVFLHGDITMIYLTPYTGPELRSISCECMGCCEPKNYLPEATFLFNIKDKL